MTTETPTPNYDTRRPPLWRLMLDGAIDASAVTWDRAVKRPAVALQVALLEEAAALLRQTIEPPPVEVVEPVVDPAAVQPDAEPVVEAPAVVEAEEVEPEEVEPVVEPAEPAVEAPAVEVVEPVKPKRKRRSRRSKVKADAPAEPPKVDPEIPAALQVGLETAPPDDGADFWQEPTTDQQTGEG